MNSRDVAEALAAWFAEEVGIEQSYPYPISNSDGPLPDVVCAVTEVLVTDQPPPELAEMGLQNVWARIFTVECSVMTEVTEQTEAAANAADNEARLFAAEIERLVWENATLGERLSEGSATSPRLTFNFETPFVEREDRVRGRFFVATLSIVEPIAAPA